MVSEKIYVDIHFSLKDIFSKYIIFVHKKVKVKASRYQAVEDCETLRLSHFPDSRLTDGGEVVSLKRRPPFTPRKIPGTHFC
jgi:hypothetical protein